MKTMILLLGMGLASFGAGCALDVNAEDREATQDEQSVNQTSEALCRRVCKKECIIGRHGRRECRTVCRTVCNRAMETGWGGAAVTGTLPENRRTSR